MPNMDVSLNSIYTELSVKLAVRVHTHTHTRTHMGVIGWWYAIHNTADMSRIRTE